MALDHPPPSSHRLRGKTPLNVDSTVWKDAAAAPAPAPTAPTAGLHWGAVGAVSLGLAIDKECKRVEVGEKPCSKRVLLHGLGPPPTIISPAPGKDGLAPRLVLARKLTLSTLSPERRSRAGLHCLAVSPDRISSLLLPVRHLSGRINMPIVEAETPGHL
ncbi:unnamed protein product [Pleuronectes platessa]|uniref:Uncharacterized protein n=1 Tax=Pleuronectes platessa TaxID=8262 RepID=A0A9N7VX12_PLEPL|nr:unnamed protein product [Pleuronectes platessa]